MMSWMGPVDALATELVGVLAARVTRVRAGKAGVLEARHMIILLATSSRSISVIPLRTPHSCGSSKRSSIWRFFRYAMTRC